MCIRDRRSGPPSGDSYPRRTGQLRARACVCVRESKNEGESPNPSGAMRFGTPYACISTKQNGTGTGTTKKAGSQTEEKH